LKCLPYGGNESTTLQGKLDVLNCLVFDTPHRFWLDKTQTDKLLNRIKTQERWLGYDDWKCTGVSDLPNWIYRILISDPSACLKHDLAYGSLTEFQGGSGSIRTIDFGRTWNPRNMALSNAVFAIDLICGKLAGRNRSQCLQDASGNERVIEVISHISWWIPKITSSGQRLMVEHKINAKIPVTRQDINHTNATPRYVECISPKISGVQVAQQGQSVKAIWIYASGCVDGFSVRSYKLCWDIEGSPYCDHSNTTTYLLVVPPWVRGRIHNSEVHTDPSKQHCLRRRLLPSWRRDTEWRNSVSLSATGTGLIDAVMI
jgi:hypothetical protein